MKCPYCDGTGTSNVCVNGTFKPCAFCDGTGEVKQNLCESCGTICPFDDEHSECENYTPMTNEQYLRTCTTEQLAEWLSEKLDYCQIMWYWACDKCTWSKKHESCMNDKEKWVEWLKEKHE